MKLNASKKVSVTPSPSRSVLVGANGRGEWKKGDAGVVERQQVARLGLLPVVRVVLFRVVLSVTGRAALVADLHRVRRRGEPILAINPNSSPVTHALFMTLPFEMGRTVTLCDSR
ncbi:MAG: hypothetical protein H0V13_05390 [Nocardioidaceae bacterium]|nr:hypothetical protein [Nocardioidaceae bacterium]